MHLFEVDEGGARKFYRLSLEGKRLVMTWGRIGTDGQTKTMDFATDAEARAELEKQRIKRLEHGYTLIRDESAIRDMATARAEKEKQKLTASAPLTDVPRFLFRRKTSRLWLEQHDAEVWSQLDEQPVVKEPIGGKRAFDARIAKLIGDGWVLDAFGAAEPKKAKKAPVPKPPAPAPAPRAAWPPPSKSLEGYTFAFFGEFAVWPAYHAGTPAQIAALRRGRVRDTITDEVNVVVLGELRGAGRADAKKNAEKRGLLLLDEAAYRDFVRLDLTGKRFAFAGNFDFAPSGVEDGTLARMVQNVGGIVTADVDEKLDFLVVGNRRGESKVAMQNRAEKLGKHVIDESAFIELVRVEKLADGAALDFATFLNHLYSCVDEAKLGRAMKMLRTDRHQLFANHDEAHLVGVVKSQTGSDSVYASHVRASGEYGCAQSDLADCMGLQGAPCKHLLVLVVGLVRTGELSAEQALAWMRKARGKRPKADHELSAQTFINYKGAQAGEIDWRPTETIPEDFYAV